MLKWVNGRLGGGIYSEGTARRLGYGASAQTTKSGDFSALYQVNDISALDAAGGYAFDIVSLHEQEQSCDRYGYDDGAGKEFAEMEKSSKKMEDFCNGYPKTQTV